MGNFFRTVNPIAVGRRVFLPSRPDRVDDPAVRTVQTIRSVLGLGVIAAVMVVYRLAGSVGEAASQRFNDAWYEVLALCVTVPVVVAVFIVSRGRGRRGMYLRRSLAPFGALVSLFAAMFMFPLAMAPELEGVRGLTGPAQPVVNTVVFAFMLVWVLPFVLYGIAMSLVHVFRTADVHEYLPPLLTTVAVWELAAVGALTGDYAGVPGSLRALLLLGGPVSVTVISAWEYSRLRRHPALVR